MRVAQALGWPLRRVAEELTPAEIRLHLKVLDRYPPDRGTQIQLALMRIEIPQMLSAKRLPKVELTDVVPHLFPRVTEAERERRRIAAMAEFAASMRGVPSA